MAYSKQISIDRPSCPKGHGNLEIRKTWILKGKGRKNSHKETGCKVTEWKCPICEFVMRTYDKLTETEQ